VDALSPLCEADSAAATIVANLEADGFNIFLASPSGLDEYRRAARDQCEHVRRIIASPKRIDFDPIGWEDIPPGFGRPQGVINPMLDECNVLIGIIGKQLGTSTGEADSGFVEEYERMAARASKGEDVAIWIYALRLTPDDYADPGDKLKAVLSFRERLYKEALIKEVGSVDDFAGQLFRDLVALLLDVDERRHGRSESAVPTTAEEARPAPQQEPSDEAQHQLQHLLVEASKEAPFLPDKFRNERFPLIRLGLWISALESWHFTNETVDVHQLNRMYMARGQAVLSSLEGRHVLRSMCAHQKLGPGWALLEHGDATASFELLTLASADGDDAVRSGALEMLEPGPVDAWLARGDVSLDRPRIFELLLDQIDETSDSVRDAIVNFAERMAWDEAIDFLTALVDRDATKQQAGLALIRLQALKRSSLAFQWAGSAEEIDDRTLLGVRAAAVDAKLDELEQLVTGSDERLRVIGVQLLAARGKEAVPLLVQRLDDPAGNVALAAFSALCEIEDPTTDLDAVFNGLVKREGLTFDRDLRRALDGTRDVSQLRESLDWLDPRTASAYQVLAEDHWDDFCHTVRRDLQDNFTAFADASRARLKETFGQEVIAAIEAGGENLVTASGSKVTPVDPGEVKKFSDFLAGSDWNSHQFAIAALAGIASHGEPVDLPLARRWLESDNREVRETAARGLARIGTEDDLSKLLDLSKKRDGNAFACAALSISPGASGAALALLESSRAASLLGARHLHSHADEIPDETLELLLHHSVEEVRRIGIACALAVQDDEGLIELLDRYVNGESYYYSVVFWLDRILFGPPYLRKRTRSEILKFAAEDPAAELSDVVSRAGRSLYERLARLNS